MIPRTFPSTFALNGQQQMVVHFLTSVDGLERWSDYIPVKLEQGGPENSYSGCIDVVAISELTADTQAWKEYIPVHVDDEATDTWTVNNVGYIPYNFALFAEAAMQLDLTNGADLDYRVTFNRTTNATVTGPDGLIAYAEHNLLRFSESFDNAGWSKDAGVSVSANTTAAPDGTFTADAVTWASAANIFQGAIVGTGVLTFSMYARVASGTANFLLQVFNTTNGTFSSTTLTATTSWQRFSFNFTVTANSFWIIRSPVAQSIFLWGAQLEQSSTAREYYPTTVKNLLGFTEHFDNAAWTKNNSSISATKVDDIYGEPFAQKLVENTANGEHFLTANTVSYISGTAYTYSCYAKAAERHFFRISFSSAAFPSTERFAYFNLAAGVLGTVAPNVTASITDVGNGWYRCAITRAATSSNTVTAGFLVVCDQDDNTTYTGDGTSGIFIFGAQLSDSASVDPYVYQPVAAPASTAYYGPRFDYDPVTLAPKGLLIEEQRTNLLLRSEEFDNAYWTKFQSTVTANSIVAPDGAISGDLLIPSEVSGPHFISRNITTAASPTTISVYLKYAGIQYVYVDTFLTAAPSVTFDLLNGTVNRFSAGVTASISPVGNDWYRCVFTVTPEVGTTTLRFFPSLDPISVSFAGNGVDGVFIWGAQLEVGAFPTSYIPTSASQVTRAADNASMIGNNFARWYNVNEGTLFAQYVVNGLNPGASNAAYGISDGATSNFIAGRTLSSAATNFQVRTGGADQAALVSVTVAAGAVAKSAGVYALNDFAFSANAGPVQTDLSGTPPVVTQMQIGGLTAAANLLNGTISRISYFNRRLANAELQAITG